jgi:DNA-binding response OmpR family regulator
LYSRKKHGDNGIWGYAYRGGESMALGGIEKRILIAEDDPQILSMLNTIFRREMLTDTAPNGLRAYELFLQYRPDIVLTDVDMPYMNGSELSMRLRRDHGYEGPIIVMTGSRLEDIVPTLRLRADHPHGVDEIITKPFDIAMLKRSIARRIEQYQLVPV